MNSKQLSEETFERLFRYASIGIIITDTKFNILMINKSAGIFFDIDPKKAEGKPIETIVPEHRRKITRRLLERSVQRGKSVEYRIKRVRKGIRHYLAIIVDPIKDEKGNIEGACLWIRDLSRRMELEKRLSQIEKLASLGQLAGGVAHHFNNIFGGIITAVDYALAIDDIEIQKRTLERISEGINKAASLTRKLLEFSERQTPEKDLADLTEVLIGFMERNESKLTKENIQLELEIKNAPIVAVHPGKLNQILQALLANSKQAIGITGGKIKITIDSDNENVYLIFADTGRGISPEIKDRIFEPFFTTYGSLGGGGEGNLGLGLTIARKLAEDIGGTLEYKDCKSKEYNTCFVLTFNIRQ